MCTRFLTVLGSGTLWKKMRGVLGLDGRGVGSPLLGHAVRGEERRPVARWERLSAVHPCVKNVQFRSAVHGNILD